MSLNFTKRLEDIKKQTASHTITNHEIFNSCFNIYIYLYCYRHHLMSMILTSFQLQCVKIHRLYPQYSCFTLVFYYMVHQFYSTVRTVLLVNIYLIYAVNEIWFIVLPKCWYGVLLRFAVLFTLYKKFFFQIKYV